jgi:hypothetical protein
MTTGTRNIITRLITILALLSETLDFVERERERAGERGEVPIAIGRGTRGEVPMAIGRVVKPILHFQNTLHILTGSFGQCRFLVCR